MKKGKEQTKGLTEVISFCETERTKEVFSGHLRWTTLFVQIDEDVEINDFFLF